MGMQESLEASLSGEPFSEIMRGIRADSEVVILDFRQIHNRIPDHKDMSKFFASCRASGEDPKKPESRQRFNDNFLGIEGKRYLIGRYCEDRIEMLMGSHMADEGRTFHLGVDVFCMGLESVYSPADGCIVRVGNEPGPHSYGNYIIVEHETEGYKWYSFFGHMTTPTSTGIVKRGQVISRIGDIGENGGWSRHLHYQLLRELPDEGQTPIGYSTAESLELNKVKFPDPCLVLGNLY